MTKPSAEPREYAIDWSRSPDSQIEVRDLRDGIPVDIWETHVIEHSAYARLKKQNEVLRVALDEIHKKLIPKIPRMDGRDSWTIQQRFIDDTVRAALAEAEGVG